MSFESDQARLLGFLAARFDEDEATARATIEDVGDVVPGRWIATRDKDEHASEPPTLIRLARPDQGLPPGFEADYVLGWETIVGAHWRTTEALALASVQHIVRHDPATVLTDIAVKREIVAECLLLAKRQTGAPDDRWSVEKILSMLAMPYADHPDYPKDGHRAPVRPAAG